MKKTLTLALLITVVIPVWAKTEQAAHAANGETSNTTVTGDSETSTSSIENKSFARKKRFISVGALWHSSTQKIGGSFELGFTLYQNKSFLIRNMLTANGYARNSHSQAFGSATVGNKLLLGGYIQHPTFAVIPYGFLQGEIGLYGMPGKPFFSAPIMFDLNGGGGFEFCFHHAMGFFVEYGGGWYCTAGRKNTAGNISGGYTSLSLGYRHYF